MMFRNEWITSDGVSRRWIAMVMCSIWWCPNWCRRRRSDTNRNDAMVLAKASKWLWSSNRLQDLPMTHRPMHSPIPKCCRSISLQYYDLVMWHRDDRRDHNHDPKTNSHRSHRSRVPNSRNHPKWKCCSIRRSDMEIYRLIPMPRCRRVREQLDRDSRHRSLERTPIRALDTVEVYHMARQRVCKRNSNDKWINLAEWNYFDDVNTLSLERQLDADMVQALADQLQRDTVSGYERAQADQLEQRQSIGRLALEPTMVRMIRFHQTGSTNQMSKYHLKVQMRRELQLVPTKRVHHQAKVNDQTIKDHVGRQLMLLTSEFLVPDPPIQTTQFVPMTIQVRRQLYLAQRLKWHRTKPDPNCGRPTLATNMILRKQAHIHLSPSRCPSQPPDLSVHVKSNAFVVLLYCERLHQVSFLDKMFLIQALVTPHKSNSNNNKQQK